jgi:membrane protein YdbS with pleckstrin-like domain
VTSYIDQTLGKNETVLLRAHVALSKYWLNFLLGGFFLFGALIFFAMPKPDTPAGQIAGNFLIFQLVIAALLLVPPFLRRITNELALTNRRVIAKYGLLTLNSVDIKLEKIESISVHQGIFGRLLNYGTVVVTGTGSTHAIIPSISNPIIFRKLFDQTLENIASTNPPQK